MLEKNAPSILIVEDEVASLNLLASYFEAENYLVYKAEDSNSAESVLKQKSIDVVLLDINIPGKDGLSLTREIRNTSNIGIILVTQKKDDIDRIVGLELGADDYVTKPYNPRELFVRVKNLVHRVKTSSIAGADTNISKKEIYFDGWTLNLGRRVLIDAQGEKIQLTEGEFKLLSALINNAGTVLSRDQIMNRMERRDWFPTDRTIDVLIARIRKKLGDDRDSPKYINTAHGTGYVFVAEVTRN